jgi:cell division protein ZapA
VEASILGRTFRIGCAPEEEAQVREAVDYLDAKMREIRDSGKVVGHERIAIMAALNIAHELLTLRLADGFDIGSFKRKMRQMAASIDETLSAQDQLF